MKKGIIAIGVIGALAGLFFLTSSTTEDSSNSAQQNTETVKQQKDMSAIADNLPDVIADVVARQSDPNVYVLDVRTDEEWDEGHATNALHWQLETKLRQGELPDMPKNSEIYVYCRSGNRSGQAIKIMQEAGYTNLTNIGGLTDWVGAGGPTAITQ